MRNNNNSLNQYHFMNFYMSKLKGVMYPTFLVWVFMMGSFGVSWGQQCDPPTISVGYNPAGCQGESISLEVNGLNGATYIWTVSSTDATFGSTSTTVGTNTLISLTSNTYNVSVTQETSTCSVSLPVSFNVIVNADNTVGAASSTPTLCINAPLTNITHVTTGATGIQPTTTNYGLPVGVTAAFDATSGTITISGTPTTATGSPFNYSIPLTGGCGTANAIGTITVTPDNTVSGPGNASTCVNTQITAITHTTTGATGIGTPTGLPDGVTATFNWSATSGTITISGAPTTSSGSPFNYTIPLTGGCGSVNATGAITVTPTVGTPTTITVSAGTEPTCQITNGTMTTTYSTTATNSTSFTWSVLPAGAGTINAASGVMTWAIGYSGTATISVTANGCNGPSTAITRSVVVTPTVGTPTAITVSAGTEPTCQLTNGTITTTYSTTATNSTSFNWSVLPAGAGTINATSGIMTWANGYSGTATISVTANGCNGPSTAITRSLTVIPSSAVGTISANQNICTGSQPDNISISNATGTIQWQWSSDLAFTSQNNIGTNSTILSGLTIGVLTSTRYFRAVVTSGVCASVNSNIISVVVSPISAVGAISSNQNICANTQPADISIANATGTIQWQWSSDLAFTSPNNLGQNSTTLSGSIIGVLTSTRYFRAIVKSGECQSVISSTATITVNPQPTAGAITINGNNPQAICAKNNVSASFGQGSGGFNGSPLYKFKINNEAYQNYIPGAAINTNAENFELNGGKITFQSIYATGSGVGCNQSDSVKSIIINPLPQPIININESSSNFDNDGSICSGDQVTLKAINQNMISPSPYTYLWNNTATSENITQELFYSAGNNIFNYKITITDDNNCSHNSERNITVWENPVSDPKLKIAGVTLFHGNKFTLDGSTSLIGSGDNPSYLWTIEPKNVITDYDLFNKNVVKMENLSVTSNNNIEFITAKLMIVNGKECKNEANLQFESRSTTSCGITVSDRKKRYCESQDVVFKYKLNRSITANNWLYKKLSLSQGATIGGKNEIDPLPDEASYNIKTVGSGSYFVFIDAKDELGCEVEPKKFDFEVVPKPSLSIISSKKVDLKNPSENYIFSAKIQGTNIDNEEYNVRLIRRQIGISKTDTLSITLTKNSNSKAFSYLDFADGKNELYVDQICYKDTELKDCCTKVDSTIIINVLGCSSIFNDIGNFPAPKVSSSSLCSKDTLQIELGPIKFKQEIWTALSIPALKVYLSKNNTKDKANQDVVFSQILEYPLIIDQDNNINVSIPANEITADQDFFVWYEIQPRSSDSICKSIPHNLSERIVIRPSPVIPTLSIPDAICKNASLIPLVATTSTSSSVGSGGYDYRWSLMNNINGVVLSNASNPYGYISIEEKIQESAFSLSFTQTNRYDGNLTCPSTSLFKTVTIINVVAPNRSTIARYPGHVYFLEDTISNLCVQWGLANDNTFNNNSILPLNTSTNPKISQSGFAVFGNDILTGELESLKKYLWADTWFKTGPTCDFATAECITRTYYNASLPPKGAPRSTPDTYQAVIYPNPNTGQFTLSLQGDWADTFTVDLLDYTGRQVAKLGQIDKALFKTESTIDIQVVLPGLYLLRVVGTDGLARTHKVTIY